MKNQNETNLMNPSDTSTITTTTTSVAVTENAEQTIESQTVSAMEKLSLETANDLSAANKQERANSNEIQLPPQQENEMTGSLNFFTPNFDLFKFSNSH